MGNLKSDWNFSATSVDLAAKDDQFALRICAVDLKKWTIGTPILSCPHRHRLGEEVPGVGLNYPPPSFLLLRWGVSAAPRSYVLPCARCTSYPRCVDDRRPVPLAKVAWRAATTPHVAYRDSRGDGEAQFVWIY